MFQLSPSGVTLVTPSYTSDNKITQKLNDRRLLNYKAILRKCQPIREQRLTWCFSCQGNLHTLLPVYKHAHTQNLLLITLFFPQKNDGNDIDRTRTYFSLCPCVFVMKLQCLYECEMSNKWFLVDVTKPGTTLKIY